MTRETPPKLEPGDSLRRRQLLTRRKLLEDLVRTTTLALGGSLLSGCGIFSDWTLRELTQSHYLRMSPDELESVVLRIEGDVFKRYRKRPVVNVEPAETGVRYVQALDLSVCIGCGRCREGCFQENNQSRDPSIKWITMLHSEKQEIWRLHDTRAFENPPLKKDDHQYYLPLGCQQCENPSCAKACPARATWKEPDGIIVIDYNWCIGCRYCQAACPYGARKFNWRQPSIPSNDINPMMHYLGNRPRMMGVVEKCTFCIQRVRAGIEPACVAVCPVRARKFGDLNDPTSEVHFIVNEVRTIKLKEDLGTKPRFYYYFSAGLT